MPQSNYYYADGTLTLHGAAVPVVLNFQIEHFDDQNATATGYVTLRRTEFGVGQGQWSHDDVIKDEVRVEFRVSARKQ
jgi:polyisoprenoid-binding protein YceI